jgi:hypothetical protein
MLTESYLLDAGWLFFAAWSVIVAVVTIAAFGRDFFPSKTRMGRAPEAGSTKTARPGGSARA